MIQNEPTGRMVKVTRATGRSSDYLGPCEICSKNMPEAYAARYGRERKRANGEVYIDKSGKIRMTYIITMIIMGK